MVKKPKSIPLNLMVDKSDSGIVIGKASVIGVRTFEEGAQSHRDDYHLFFLQEEGAFAIEIDFQSYRIIPRSVVYIQPDQVHRIGAFEDATVSYWMINNDNLHDEQRRMLEDLSPVSPMQLDEETYDVISNAVSLCLQITERRNDKLYHTLVKDSCNTLAGLVASHYAKDIKTIDGLSRFEVITKAFKTILAHNFISTKKPAAYAASLNISAHYLNECVKNTTGHSVSRHIQQRLVLEAKRLLYHSGKSVKEIAAELGFDDYPYFSRLFSKATGVSPLAFRNGILSR
ncbi:transcriptional regulator, AraC family protein [Pedobacter sp. BAL39]|uniref:helix-turn-helix transcriptional regulator n=1 Tax=Pedobacter sp. BAL39 TaxID=391596 RepID=UPI0001559E83|nr:helix-turn-helix transcriptional regulator [Pedobacter sp. BAL39]EDM34896.1 transcriptional regulator, AraC family protein [Pedobacter sp. BAL39]